MNQLLKNIIVSNKVDHSDKIVIGDIINVFQFPPVLKLMVFTFAEITSNKRDVQPMTLKQKKTYITRAEWRFITCLIILSVLLKIVIMRGR